MKKKLICYFVYGMLLLAPFLAVASEYTVGDGDVVAINVYENPDLSTTVRVSANDTIRVPLVGEVGVKNLSVSQVAAKLEKLLADGYLVNPQVDVFIKEYRSKKAVILGQVKNPGLYELRGGTTILEFISTAGGVTAEVGSTATIKRKTTDAGEEDQIVVDLDSLIKTGDTALNLPIRDRDSVYISKADIYYVSGEVVKPGSFKLESDVTVIKAITVAGGFSKIAAKGKVRIIRIVDGQKREIENVKMDERVLPNDVIVVPESFF
ncbi:MAG: polysaccharide biosynthesis/export family protein [Pseudomonadota bacterium]